MDFGLAEEQQPLYQTVKKFAAREIEPGAEERDRTGEFCWEGWRKMGEMGLLGLPFPEEYGGGGAGALTTALAMEAFGAGSGDVSTPLSWGGYVGRLDEAGRDEWWELSQRIEEEASRTVTALAQYWADGQRTLAEISGRIALETGLEATPLLVEYFRFVERLGLIELAPGK